jgi:hypothetical protein
MLTILVQLLVLARASAQETVVSQLEETQGTGAEKFPAAKAVVTAEANTLADGVTEGRGEKAQQVTTKQPSEDDLPFMPVSWIQIGADAEQGAAAAAAQQQAQMMAGLDRMGRNLETVEQAKIAIGSLSSDEHKVAMITKLLDSVSLLEAALDELQTQHISPEQVGARAAGSHIQNNEPQVAPVSLLETGAEAKQMTTMGTRAAAEAHRAAMLAGVDRLNKNIEAIEQTRDAITSLEDHDEKLPLIEQLSGAVNFLKGGLAQLQEEQAKYVGVPFS